MHLAHDVWYIELEIRNISFLAASLGKIAVEYSVVRISIKQVFIHASNATIVDSLKKIHYLVFLQ